MNAAINEIIIQTLMPYNLKEIALFGSYARGDMNSESDIDILVDFKDTIPLLLLGKIYTELQEKLNRKIDLVTKKGLNPLIAPYIQEDLVAIYNG